MTDKNEPSEEELHKTKEIEQERVISDEVTRILQEQKSELEKKVAEESHKIKELEQESGILEEISKTKSEQILYLSKKYRLRITIISVIVAASLIGYFSYQNMLIEEHIQKVGPLNTAYVIQNLRGDTIKTWTYWNIASGRALYVEIINSASLSDEKINVIKDAILSDKFVDIPDNLFHKGPQGKSSVYYMGWEGALTHLPKNDTTFNIPTRFDIQSPRTVGDISIELTKDENADGYAGYTRSVTDQNQILKSHITVYRADSLTDDRLSALVRHEFGHALGLGHSTDSEDLMAPMIQTEYPFISDCDRNAIIELYDGKKNSEVVCEK